MPAYVLPSWRQLAIRVKRNLLKLIVKVMVAVINGGKPLVMIKNRPNYDK